MKCGFVKVAMCTPPLTVGAPEQNLNEIKRLIKDAHKHKAELVVFGQLALTGSTLGSMIKYNQLLKGTEAALKELVKFSESINPVMVAGVPIAAGNKVENAAAVIKGGQLAALIPAGNPVVQEIELFGEKFPLNSDTLIRAQGLGFNFSVVFGEDFDQSVPRAQKQAAGGADIIVNLASSAALIDSFESRIQKIKTLTKRLSCAYVYVSTGAGEAVSENVFSGDKIAGELGEVVTAFEGDEKDILYAELDADAVRAEKDYKDKGAGGLPATEIKLKSGDAEVTRPINRLPFVPVSAEFDRIFDIMGRGILTRMRVAGANKLILGLSGGLDSTILLLACERMFKKYRLNLKDIVAVTMPGDSSSTRTKKNAARLIELLGVTGIEIPIEKAVTDHLNAIGHNSKGDVVYENAQARERTQILLDLANKHNALMLGTGDLSETALGWSTYGGDQLAQYNPNSSLAKTLIRAMTRNYCLTTKNSELAIVLNDVLSTPISPELLRNQDTEKLIGPYELHDFFLYNLIGKGFTVEKVYTLAALAFFDYSKKDILKYLRIFITRFFANQFKRSSACDGIQLTEFDLSDKVIHSEFSAEQFLNDVEQLEELLASKNK